MVSEGGFPKKTIEWDRVKASTHQHSMEAAVPEVVFHSVLQTVVYLPSASKLSSSDPLTHTVGCDQALNILFHFLESVGQFHSLCLLVNEARHFEETRPHPCWGTCCPTPSPIHFYFFFLLEVSEMQWLFFFFFFLFCSDLATVRGREENSHILCLCCRLPRLG